MVETVKIGFPVDLITPEMSVLSLFSAAFYGENDVQHLKKIGCADVTLIDLDQVKLSKTGEINGYNTLCFDIIQAFEDNEKFNSFDVVVCDQWSNMDEIIHVKFLHKLLSMTRKYLILSCTEDWLQGTKPVPGEYYFRSNYKGGVYWRVICK